MNTKTDGEQGSYREERGTQSDRKLSGADNITIFSSSKVKEEEEIKGDADEDKE